MKITVEKLLVKKLENKLNWSAWYYVNYKKLSTYIVKYFIHELDIELIIAKYPPNLSKDFFICYLLDNDRKQLITFLMHVNTKEQILEKYISQFNKKELNMICSSQPISENFINNNINHLSPKMINDYCSSHCCSTKFIVKYIDILNFFSLKHFLSITKEKLPDYIITLIFQQINDNYLKMKIMSPLLFHNQLSENIQLKIFDTLKNDKFLFEIFCAYQNPVLSLIAQNKQLFLKSYNCLLQNDNICNNKMNIINKLLNKDNE